MFDSCDLSHDVINFVIFRSIRYNKCPCKETNGHLSRSISLFTYLLVLFTILSYLLFKGLQGPSLTVYVLSGNRKWDSRVRNQSVLRESNTGSGKRWSQAEPAFT